MGRGVSVQPLRELAHVWAHPVCWQRMTLVPKVGLFPGEVQRQGKAANMRATWPLASEACRRLAYLVE